MKNAFEYEAELPAFREELATITQDRDYCKRVATHNKDLGEQAQQRLADAERRIADRDALLRSTSARLWNAHLALNRLIELEPAHKVKLLTDTIHVVAYAHKCIDMPHWDAAINKPEEAKS